MPIAERIISADKRTPLVGLIFPMKYVALIVELLEVSIGGRRLIW
jgi:hypothetical protein